MNVNKVILAGRLTRDPELKYTTTGTPVCSFALASNRTWKGEAGVMLESTVFVDATAFAGIAEIIAKHFAKGREIFIEGRLNLDTWEDKKTGEKRRQLNVIVENFQFVGPKPEDSAG